MEVKNLTPHNVVLVNDVGEELMVFEPEGLSVRAKVSVEKVGELSVAGVKVPVTQSKLGELENLPDEQNGVVLVVSRLVAEMCKGRTDLVVPNETVRDENGNVVGCKSLARL